MEETNTIWICWVIRILLTFQRRFCEDRLERKITPSYWHICHRPPVFEKCYGNVASMKAISDNISDVSKSFREDFIGVTKLVDQCSEQFFRIWISVAHICDDYAECAWHRFMSDNWAQLYALQSAMLRWSLLSTCEAAPFCPQTFQRNSRDPNIIPVISSLICEESAFTFVIYTLVFRTRIFSEDENEPFNQMRYCKLVHLAICWVLKLTDVRLAFRRSGFASLERLRSYP